VEERQSCLADESARQECLSSTTMNWLANLPHQIPFRAASAVRRVDDKTIEGVYVCTANDILPTGVMVLEAMAQFAGGLVLKEQGFLTGMDRCEVLRPIEPGDELVLTVVTPAEEPRRVEVRVGVRPDDA